MAAELTSVERRGQAMGSDVHLIVVGHPNGPAPGDLVERARGSIARLEAHWSRFVPSSDVSRMNATPARPVEVSTDTITLVNRAVQAWDVSGGLVDCTTLGALLAAGYDRSFERLGVDGVAPGGTRAVPPPALFGPGDIVVAGSTVTMPPGVGFDPGGVGKGLAADLVVGELLDAGAVGVCVALGGDVRLAGLAPDGGTWTVSIDHPHVDRPLALVGLVDGAVATSTTLRRTWTGRDGRRRHHLIDPTTGRPAASPVELAGAVAGSGWQAETAAKAVLLAGGPAVLAGPRHRGVEALAVLPEAADRPAGDPAGPLTDRPPYRARVVTSGGFARFTGGLAVDGVVTVTPSTNPYPAGSTAAVGRPPTPEMERSS
ncbi:MAG: FAD:protein FMN transferase [Acidimicrobiales bacterium]